MSYPGVIQAFYYHENRMIIVFPSGIAQVVLQEKPMCITKVVAHGYLVLGGRPTKSIYVNTESYKPKKTGAKLVEWKTQQLDLTGKFR